MPGRVFTKRLYSNLKLVNKKGKVLQQHHHVSLNKEFRMDCAMWKVFLQHTDSLVISRPFLDLNMVTSSKAIRFHTDASGNPLYGFGCVFGEKYTWCQWEPKYIKWFNASIQYLELYALCVGLLTWQSHPTLCNARLIIYCDNKSVRDMVNSTSSDCKNCMFLLRILVLDGLLHNRRVTVRYVESRKNKKADALSRMKLDLFFKYAPKSRKLDPSPLPKKLWPASKIWQR